MRVHTFGRAHIERRKGPQALAGQLAVHGRCRKDHRHRHAGRIAELVGQHDVTSARAHGVFCLVPDAAQVFAQVVAPRLKRTVDGDGIRVEFGHQLIELRVREERAVEHEDLGLGAGFIQHVLEVPEPRFQAHDAEFAQAVDGRVGDLAEVLAEEVAERAVLVRQNRRRGVIAHGRQGLFRVFGHRCEDLLEVFDGIARCHLTAAQLIAREQGLFLDIAKRFVQLVDLADPFTKGARRGELVLDLGVAEHLAFFDVDRQQLTGAKRAFAHDIRLVLRDHPRLGTRDQHAVTGDDETHGAQAVPVKTGADPAAIGHGQRCGTIPRLHHRVAVGIHVAPCLGQFDRLLGPAFRHQHGFRHRGRTTRAHQDFEHRIQRGRIGRPRGDDRFDIFGHVAKGARGHANLVAFHPVDVTLERVDLAVVGQHAEGLRQPPLREGVGGIALVIDRKRGFKAFVHQVGVEVGNILRQHHALVDDRPAGHRRDVKRRHLSGQRGFLDAATDDVKLALECFLVHALGVGNQDLFDLGTGRIGLFPQNRGVHGHVAPAVDIVAHAQHFGFNDGPAGFLRGKVGARQKDLTDGDQFAFAGAVTGATHLIVEKVDGDLHVDARAVAGLAIGIHRTTVPDRLERLDPVFDNRAAAGAVDVHNKTHPAG